MTQLRSTRVVAGSAAGTASKSVIPPRMAASCGAARIRAGIAACESGTRIVVDYVYTPLVLMGRHHDAERSALKAIQMYEAGPTDHRSYGDEALARVDVAAARLGLSDLDGVQAALEPVFRLPPERRIKQISAGLARTRALLAVAQYARARVAVEINVQLDTFGVPRANVLPDR